MADEKPNDQDRLDARYREVWRAATPPAGFLDQVLALTDAEAAKAGGDGQRGSRRRRWGLALALGGVGAVAAALALVFALRTPAARDGEHRAETDRLSVPITDRAVAVLEPRARLRWRAANGRVTVEQTAGEVFYRVDRGVTFEVKTGAGSVLVRGTCFKVEVNAMSPMTHSIVGAVAGVAVTALAVTVYEGSVDVQNAQGETRLGPGESGVVESGSAPRLAGHDGTARKAGSPGVPRLSPETVASLGADARATIASLETQVASLTSELQEARREAIEGKRDKDGIPKNKYHDFTPDELAALARRCEIRYDIPSYLMQEPSWEVGAKGAAEVGITEAQRAQLNQQIRQFAPAHVEQLRALYIEGTGDQAGAAKISPRDIQHALFERFPAELGAAKQRLAQERAGQIAPPGNPAGGSVVERMLRLITASGDELERRAAQVIGAERVHQLRREGQGYGGRRIQNGCPK